MAALTEKITGHVSRTGPKGGFQLADTQFLTDHLSQFGVEEVPRHIYKRQLAAAITERAEWAPPDRIFRGSEALAALGIGSAVA